ncbi:MAG: M48 family peptidase [Thermosynechococcaceae cyanobacterium]
MRIAGLVRAAHQVRDQLRAGVPAGDKDRLQQFIKTTLQTVEALCADAQMVPEQLPPPSRKAYAYLKQLNLNQLPSTDAPPTPMLDRSIRIQNVRAQQQEIQQAIAHLAKQPTPDTAQFKRLDQTLQQAVGQIESGCRQRGLTPASLNGMSRQVYAWMKFLLEGQSLQAHLQTVRRVQQLAHDIMSPQKPYGKGFAKETRSKVMAAPVIVEITAMTALYHCKWVAGSRLMQINEGFIAADDTVLQPLVQAMLIGKSPDTGQTIKQFAVSEEFCEIALAIDLMVGTISDRAKGVVYDLNALFERINGDYFQGKLAKPQLAWSQGLTRRKFGHYEPSHDRVVISLTLDNKRVPDYAIAFVMYHELLHKWHGETWSNGRRMVHTPAFRQDERQFKQYQEASAALGQLARTVS